MKNPLLFGLLCCGLTTLAQTEIPVNSKGYVFYPNEPTIAINRQHPDTIVVCTNLYNKYISTDNGQTWEDTTITSEYGMYGDPVLHATPDGNLYLTHLTIKTGFLDRMVIQGSSDGGFSFDRDSYTGLNGTKNQDKPWLSSDDSETSPFYKNLYITWTEFDKYESKKKKDRSKIRFSSSSDLSKSWSEAITISDTTGICLDDDHALEGATTAVGTDGTIYCVWAGHYKLYFDKSSDGGKTWGRDKIIGNQYAGWAQDIPNVYRTNGMPFLLIDNSPNSKFKGRLYVVYGDRINKDANVYMLYSDDRGEHWSEPIRVNQKEDGDQFMPNAAIDPKDGTLAIIYYDRRNCDLDVFSDVYVSLTSDGGNTFEDVRLNSQVFKPHGSKAFSGDYIDIDLYDGKLAAVWTGFQDYSVVYTRVMDLNNPLRNVGFMQNQFVYYSSKPKSRIIYLRTNQNIEITDRARIAGVFSKVKRSSFQPHDENMEDFRYKMSRSLFTRHSVVFVVEDGVQLLRIDR
ncbi:MAG: glycosyl hydrolase [Bacteroidetes bacterium]|nr:glycosyl hydrolase [Bacteroidota bacterium]